MQTAKLALTQLKREWRAGELYVLFLALVVAVAAVTSVNFFTDRVHRALKTQANELLGADLVLSSDQRLDVKYINKANELGLKRVRQISFPSMVLSDSANQLTWLKVVDPGFPLRGKLGISDKLFAPEKQVKHIVEPGKVWVEPRLITAMGIKIGDHIQIGEKQFMVDAILSSEPGRGGDMFNIAPRVLMNYADIASTKLIQPGSRVRYSLLLAGDLEKIKTYRSFVTAENETGIRIQGVEDARPEIRQALSRAEQFLGLAALASVILAGVAIALAARRFANTHLDHCAIMRCVGATQRMILQIYFLQILFIGLIASAIGVAVGFVFHQLLIETLGSLVGVTLPMPSAMPAFFGAATGMVTLLGFALPPIIALKSVPALRVLKRDLGIVNLPGIFNYLMGILALAIVMVWQSRDVKMGLYMVAGALLTIVVLALVALVLLFVLRLFRQWYQTPALFGLRNLTRRPAATVVQMVAFGLGMMALLVLTLIRGDLLDQWQASIPDDAPNRFVINIHPDQVDDLKDFFKRQNYPVPEFYPMVRGRLVEINEQPISEDTVSSRGAKQLLSRELNLSWATNLANHNKVIEGQWWSVGADSTIESQFSIEKSVSENLNIKLGDRLKFKIAGQYVEAKVSSVREVDWGSFRANFYVIASPGLLDDMPATYMSPFYLPPDKFELLNKMLAEFANVTVIDVAAVMSHVRQIINRVTMAVEYVFLFTLVSGLMVLLAGIQSTHDERTLENAIVRTVGGSSRQIYRSLIMEFVSLGVLSGLVAALLATVIGAVLAHFVLKTPVDISESIWLIGLLGGGLGVGVAGLLGSRRAVTQPPMVVLKSL